jgi:drug/metabolite transporter (DMT)-like permease
MTAMKTLLMLLVMISFTVIANLLLKTGAVADGQGYAGLGHLLNWRVILGLASFGLAGCFYVVLLQWLPLNVAQSFAAAQFVAVILASAWLLAEPIRAGQWLGIALIASGIAVVGYSQY